MDSFNAYRPRATRTRFVFLIANVKLMATLGSLVALFACNPHGGKTESQMSPKIGLSCGSPAIADHLLVKLRHPEDWQDTNRLEELAEKLSGVRPTVELLGAGAVAFFRWPAADRSINQLKQLFDNEQYKDIVEYAEPDYLVPTDCPEPAGGNNQYLKKQWGLDKINACDAWRNAQGTDVVVAVIDTGIKCVDDRDSKPLCHPDLQNNIWFPPKGFSVTLGNKPVTCPNTGCFGFNARAAANAGDNAMWFPADYKGHGTQVSGIIAASADNPGVVGVSYRSKLLVVQYDNSNDGSVSSVIRAIDFVIAASKEKGLENLRVVNCSFGLNPVPGCASQTLEYEFELLSRNNILVVASNGDAYGASSQPHYPSGYKFSNIIAVTGTTETDAIGKYAYNVNATNLIGAPGDGIYTTWAGGAGFYTSDGTSMAAPFVSGVAALVLSDKADKCDKLSANDLRTEILKTADSIDALRKNIQNGWRLNAYNAVRRCKEPPH